MSDFEKQKVLEDRITIDKGVGSTTEIPQNFKSLRSILSQIGAGEVNYINAVKSVSDNQLLAEIGYKQELNRQFSTIQVFGVAFSIMGLLPSIASVMGGGLGGGPVSLVWGWFIAGLFILLIGLAMAENASAIPTAGGLYYWTYYYAPEGYKEVLSFIIGCSNSVSLAAGICSIDYGLAEEILAAVVISKDGNFEITNGKLYGVFAACVVTMAFFTSMDSKTIAKIQAFSIATNLFTIVMLFIALPIGTKRNTSGYNDGSFTFGDFHNFSDWNDGWQFCMAGFMPAVWTIGSFDSCVHQSEEAKDAKKSVPIGIISSITVCWILGWLILICLMSCVSSDLESVINSEYDFAIAQIINDSLGKTWAIAFMSLIAFCQYLMGTSKVIAISRQAYAFARDDGLPFSKYIKRVDERHSIPYYAIIFSCSLALVLGLLCLIDDTAADALFSLTVAGNYVAWSTPTIMRLTFGKDLFRPGPFYLGDLWSPIISWIGIAFQYFIIILVMFPSQKKGLTKRTMNYACVIGPGMWILSWVYYMVHKKKYYHGPKTNLTDDQYIEVVGSNVMYQILSQKEDQKK